MLVTRHPPDRMRLFRSRTHVALAAVLAAAALPASAQAPVERPATHVVKKADTLWDLAKTYLGDPFQWPQIYELNTEKIKDPHWIYPGQVFNLPGGAAALPAAADAAARAAAAAAQAAGASQRSAMTVFNPASRATDTRTRASAVLAARRTAVRPGDFESAPFMWAPGGPADGGTLDGTAESVGVAMTVALRPVQFREETFVSMPRGVTPAVGMRLLVYRMDAIVPRQGQVVVPTGILQVRSLLDGGRVRAALVSKFEDVFGGQRVTVLDTLAMPMNTFPTRVEFGISTTVVWLYAKPALPSAGHELILAASAAQGLVPGDQVTLRRARGNDAAGSLPDEEIGAAQVTRVTPWGASAIILESRDAGIAAGMRAQVTAKMP